MQLETGKRQCWESKRSEGASWCGIIQSSKGPVAAAATLNRLGNSGPAVIIDSRAGGSLLGGGRQWAASIGGSVGPRRASTILAGCAGGTATATGTAGGATGWGITGSSPAATLGGAGLGSRLTRLASSDGKLLLTLTLLDFWLGTSSSGGLGISLGLLSSFRSSFRSSSLFGLGLLSSLGGSGLLGLLLSLGPLLSLLLVPDALLLDLTLAGSSVDGAGRTEWVRLGSRGRRDHIGGLGNGALGEVQSGSTSWLRSGGGSGRTRSLATLTRLWLDGTHVVAPVDLFLSGGRNTLGTLRALGKLAARRARAISTLASFSGTPSGGGSPSSGAEVGGVAGTSTLARLWALSRGKRAPSLPVDLSGLSNRPLVVELTGRSTVAEIAVATAASVSEGTSLGTPVKLAEALGAVAESTTGRISNLDTNITTLEGLAVAGQSSLETLKISKLGIGEALGTVLLAVLDNADVDAVAVVEEVGHTLDSGIIRQVAEMSGIRRLGGELLGEVVAERVVTPVIAVASVIAIRAGASATVGRGEGLGAGTICVLDFISPRGNTTSLAEEFTQRQLLGFLFLGSHDCGLVGHALARRSA